MDQHFEQAELTRKEKQQQQDKEDYNNEMAGNDTGRIKRFSANKENQTEQDQKKKREKSLQDLLMNEEYLAAWNTATDAVNSAQGAVYDALIKARDDLTIAEKDHAELLSRAITLEDGRKVFLDDDGSVYGENGHEIQDHNSMHHHHSHAPSWRDFKDSRDHLIKADQHYDDIAEKETRLQEIDETLHDEHAGLSIEDINALKDEAIEIQHSVEPDNAIKYEESFERSTTPVAAPDLSF